MPDSKLSALVELAAAPAGTDELYVRDVSELAADESKRITITNLFTSPALVTPALGTPASGVLTNATGLPTAGLLDDAVTYAKIQNVSATDRVLGRTSVGAGDVEEIATTGSGSVVRATSPALVTPALGTPASGVMTNVTGLPTTGLVDDAVTNAKLANMAVDTVKGRVTAGTGDPEDIATTGSGNVVRATSPTLVTPALGTPASGVLTNATGLPTAGLLDAAVTLAKMADIATARIIGRNTALTGVPESLSVLPTAVMPALTGDVTNPAGSLATTIAADAVTNAKLANMAVDTVKGRITVGTGDPEDVATTGSGNVVRATSPTLVTPALGTPASGVLTNATGLPTAGLLDDAVTYAKMQNVSATDRVLGRTTVGAGDVEEIATTGSGSVVRATSPTLVTPALGTPASGVLTNATGLPTAGMLDAAVTLAKMANIATATFIGRTTAATGVPEALTVAQATALLDAATATVKGLVPAPPNNTTTFLRGDATFAAPAASGALSRAGGNTTEATTTSTVLADMLTATVSITAGTPVHARVLFRKTTGAAAGATVATKLNTVQLSSALGVLATGGNNAAGSGIYLFDFTSGVTSYLKAGRFTLAWQDDSGSFTSGPVGSSNPMPTATITSVIWMGATDNALVTFAFDEGHVYTFAVS